MRTHHRLEVTLTLLGPLLTRGGRAAAPGIDAPLARDGRGRPVLPYSLVKGKLLDAIRELRPHQFKFDSANREYGPTDPRLADWFGTHPGNGSWEPERGRLRFTDFVTDTAEKTPAPGRVIERVQVDRESGAAAGRMLAAVEAPFGYGQPVVFRGAVEFVAEPAEAEAIHATLDAAFRWVPSYGALRTAGFGRTHDVQIAAAALPARSRGRPSGGARLPLQLTPDAPLCLVGRRHSRNHFECLDTISGAALKGAVARLLAERNGVAGGIVAGTAPGGVAPTLWQHFAAVRFAEARPMAAGAARRPVEPPLSLVTVRTRPGRYFDVALDAGPRLIDGAAPKFAVDWKEAEAGLVHAAFGRVRPPRERRTRTAIDPSTGRAADERLFSYGLVLPEGMDPTTGAIRSFVWETEAGLEGVPEPDRATAARELAELLAHGLPNIGKTRATAAVHWTDAPTPWAVADGVPPPDGLHVVALQTDCLMTDPDRLTPGRPEDLEAAYREFWLEASGGAFELVRYFARQSLHGGYLARRFGRGHYEPFLVTDRGSTFVLAPAGAGSPTTVLDDWRRAGLPVPGWVASRYARPGRPLWQTCPFLPHVGFGEVAVDLECHTAHRIP